MLLFRSLRVLLPFVRATAADDERRRGDTEPVGASVLRRPRWDEVESEKQVRAIGCGMAHLRSLGHRGQGESSRRARVSVILGLSSEAPYHTPTGRDWHAMLTRRDWYRRLAILR